MAAALFYPLRRLERWLHQHIFKVGWLLTRQLRTTTTLYYTFFLPGVVLHEVVVWFVAGLLNVHAERALAWPEAQAVGELRLEFIRLARTAGRVKRAIIAAAPFVAGVVVLWLITTQVLRLQDVAALVRERGMRDVPEIVRLIVSVPDFWLWFYIAFTIANTMMPNTAELRGGWTALIALGAAVAFLLVIGAGDTVILGALTGPVAAGLQVLSAAFVVVIALDLVMVAILGTVEALVERVTGHSATFRAGRMITMTRDEARRLREQEAEKLARQKARRAERMSGPPSIYRLPLPLPDLPPRAAGDEVLVRRDETTQLTAGDTDTWSEPASPRPLPGPAQPAPRPPRPDEPEAAPRPGPRPAPPVRPPSTAPGPPRPMRDAAASPSDADDFPPRAMPRPAIPARPTGPVPAARPPAPQPTRAADEDENDEDAADEGIVRERLPDADVELDEAELLPSGDGPADMPPDDEPRYEPADDAP